MTAVLKQGNSLHLLRQIPDGTVDKVVTDPPFGVGFANHKWDKSLPNIDIWHEVFRVLKPGAHIVAFGDATKSHRLLVQLEDVGFEAGMRMAWEYPNGTPSRQPVGDFHHAQVQRTHEDIIIARKPLAEKTLRENQRVHGAGGLRVKNTLGDGATTKTILKYKKPTKTERNLGVEHFPSRRVNSRKESARSLHRNTARPNHHPCVKPIQLLAHLCHLVGNPGETILDPFMGSGSTGLAAIWGGFNFIGFELMPEYFEGNHPAGATVMRP